LHAPPPLVVGEGATHGVATAATAHTHDAAANDECWRRLHYENVFRATQCSAA